MEYKKIKKALLQVGYTNDSVKSLMCGRVKPSFAKAQILFENHKIPFEAWINIKSYVNDTKETTKKSTTPQKEKVSA